MLQKDVPSLIICVSIIIIIIILIIRRSSSSSTYRYHGHIFEFVSHVDYTDNSLTPAVIDDDDIQKLDARWYSVCLSWRRFLSRDRSSSYVMKIFCRTAVKPRPHQQQCWRHRQQCRTNVRLCRSNIRFSSHFIQQQRTKRPLTSRDKIQYYTVHTFILAYTHHTYNIHVRIYTRYRNIGAENIISSLPVSKI